MQRLFSYRQGDRAEYLAQYILSAFAISVPVPRQEDVGSDFHCSLLKRESNNLRPYLPFNIQVKSYGDSVRTEGIAFGGITDRGNWRNHEIEQLCQADTPFLIGIVNKERQWLDVFSTITRYFVRYNWHQKGTPRQVNLIPYQPNEDQDLGCGALEDLEEKANMPRMLWKLPIGQPVLRITIEDSENTETCEQIKHLLEPHLRMDQENAVFARIGLGYFNWPLRIRTGQPLHHGAVGLVSPPFDAQMLQGQILSMARMAGSLLKSYQIKGMKREILDWEQVLRQLPTGADEVISRSVQEALQFAHS
jgi:hypothetical protein